MIKPIVIGHESLAGFLNTRSRLPIIAKIQKIFFFCPKNGIDAIKSFRTQRQYHISLFSFI